MTIFIMIVEPLVREGVQAGGSWGQDVRPANVPAGCVVRASVGPAKHACLPSCSQH